MKQQVWFVTGASKGLGLTLVKELLAKGHRVAATSRDLKSLQENVGSQSAEFLGLEMNLSDEADVQKAIHKTLNAFGRIDVVVNNAGYGQFGAVEELSDRETRANFEVNVFGLLNVTRNVLPILREQKSGHILNISSIGGYVGSFPGVAVYCSTKFAVTGLTEGLYSEVKPLGIHATVVYPGYFRTNFLEKDSMGVPARVIPQYEDVRRVIDVHANQYNQKQAGDPVRAAHAMIEIAADKNPPLHLFLGSDSWNMAQNKIKEIQEALENFKSISYSTDLKESSYEK